MNPRWRLKTSRPPPVRDAEVPLTGGFLTMKEPPGFRASDALAAAPPASAASKPDDNKPSEEAKVLA